MAFYKVLRQGGPGAVLVFLYVSGSLYHWEPGLSKEFLVLASVTPAFLTAYTVEQFSDEIIRFLTFPIIKDAKRQIDKKNSREELYYDHKDKWEKLDEYDDKVYQYAVVIVSGVFIVVSLPMQGGHFYGFRGIVLALFGSTIGSVLFIYKPYKGMSKVIKHSVMLYD